jgi:hypothetical protein
MLIRKFKERRKQMKSLKQWRNFVETYSRSIKTNVSGNR